MKIIGSHVTEEDVESALFFIEDRHPGQAVAPQDGPEDTATNTGFTPFSFPVFFPYPKGIARRQPRTMQQRKKLGLGCYVFPAKGAQYE